MEVRINKEIRNYTEAMFFGLSLRQFAFSVLACGAAVALYFILRPHLALETLSWLCVVGAAPFGAAGFLRYHGMAAEQFLWAWVKSEILLPKKIGFKAVNIYHEAIFAPKNTKQEPKADKGNEADTDNKGNKGKRRPKKSDKDA